MTNSHAYQNTQLEQFPKKQFEHEWTNFFNDHNLWEQIWKDVRLDSGTKISKQRLDAVEAACMKKVDELG